MKKRATKETALRIVKKPKSGTQAAIIKGLVAFNRKHGMPRDFRLLVIPIEHPKTRKVIGGLWAATWARWLFIDQLFVPEAMRGTGVGSRLMKMAEAEAKSRKCVGAWVDTFSFQAKPFYEKLGYREFGRLRDFPPGHARHFLQKRL